MKKEAPARRRILGVLGGAGALTLLYFAVVPKPIEVEQARVERGTFREMIQTDGYLRSKDRYILPAQADGDIRRMPLKVGDPVTKGQKITELYWDLGWDPVRAPVTGVISKVHRESAGPIRRGEPIIEIVDPTRLEVVAELLTTDAARVSPGNPAVIEGWGGDEKIAATVVRMSRAGFVKQSALGVEEERTEVTLEPVNLPPQVLTHLGSTFHVDITIQVAMRENVLKVPSGAIFRDGPDWAVYRIEGGKALRTRVDVVARGNQEAMVASGVEAGDTVVVYPGDLVEPGTRVRPLKAAE